MAAEVQVCKVFIGSSSEAQEQAVAAKGELDRSIRNFPYRLAVTVWVHYFQSGDYTLEKLLQALKEFDFGVFLLTPDDEIIKREQKGKVTRDNVLFEFGLFVGTLGRRRTFVVVPSDWTLTLPSDLLGFTMLTYDMEDENDASAVSVAMREVRKRIKDEGPRSELRQTDLRQRPADARADFAIDIVGWREAIAEEVVHRVLRPMVGMRVVHPTYGLGRVEETGPGHLGVDFGSGEIFYVQLDSLYEPRFRR